MPSSFADEGFRREAVVPAAGFVDVDHAVVGVKDHDLIAEMVHDVPHVPVIHGRHLRSPPSEYHRDGASARTTDLMVLISVTAKVMARGMATPTRHQTNFRPRLGSSPSFRPLETVLARG